MTFKRGAKFDRIRLAELLVFVGITVLGLFLIIERERLSNQHHVNELRLETVASLVELRERIQSAIFDRILEMRELSTLVRGDPEDFEGPFAAAVAAYLADHPEVRSIALAPDLVVTHVYPLEGNEAVIGLDYRNNEAQLPKVLEAMEMAHGIVTGPVNLVQGGRGLILREPIILPSASAQGGRENWGILSMVLDYDYFLDVLDVSEMGRRYQLVIAEIGENTYDQQVFYGDAGQLAEDPARLLFKFPFGDWELTATPKEGWPALRPGFALSLVGELFLLLLILTGLWGLLRLFEQRRIAQRRLDNAIAALPDAFVMFDPDDRLVMCNSLYRDLHSAQPDLVRPGVTYSEIVKGGLESGLYGAAVGREDEWFQEWLELREKGNFDVMAPASNGKTIFVSDRVMADGSTVGLRIDVSELQDARMSAEAANLAKSDFIAVLSHELRTPLTVMLGMARLSKNLDRLPDAKALERAISKVPAAHRGPVEEQSERFFERVQGMMAKLENSGNHLLTLVNEILDFAKMEARGVVLEPETIDLREFLQSTLDQVRPIADEKGLGIRFELAADTLKADRKRLRQVLLNLLGNALKFTAEGEISLVARQESEGVQIELSDTGPGMPETELEKIFEPFHQVDSSGSRSAGGTGLGLAISREIVEAHGGTLVANSVLGKGSVFKVFLPFTEQTEEDPLSPGHLLSNAA